MYVIVIFAQLCDKIYICWMKQQVYRYQIQFIKSTHSFIFWTGLGFSSFFLWIHFYHDQYSNNLALKITQMIEDKLNTNIETNLVNMVSFIMKFRYCIVNPNSMTIQSDKTKLLIGKFFWMYCRELMFFVQLQLKH